MVDAVDRGVAIAVGGYLLAAIWTLADSGAVEVAVVASLAAGFAVARPWVVALPLLLIPLAIPFNETNAEGETLIGYVIVLGVPASACLLGLGYLTRIVAGRL